MKTIIYSVLVAVFFSAAVSCKKDKPDPITQTKNNMTAVWTYDKFTYQEVGINGAQNGPVQTFDQDDNVATMEFASDGSRKTSSDGQVFVEDNWEIIDVQTFKLIPSDISPTITTLTASEFIYKYDLPKDADYKKVYTVYLKK